METAKVGELKRKSWGKVRETLGQKWSPSALVKFPVSVNFPFFGIFPVNFPSVLFTKRENFQELEILREFLLFDCEKAIFVTK